MFKNFNFASASLMLFMLGILLFSSLVLMPQFLQTLLGYTSELAGLALSAGGLVLLIETPITGQLTTKIQARRIDCLRLAGAVAGNVLFHQKNRSTNEFQCRHVAAYCSGRGPGLPVCADHARRVHRDSSREEQLRRRNRQLHAQHGEQRGNVTRYNL